MHLPCLDRLHLALWAQSRMPACVLLRNPCVRHITASKWTAMRETLKWRHFSVIQVRKQSSGGVTFVQMQASCDSTACLWVRAHAHTRARAWAATSVRAMLQACPGPCCRPGCEESPRPAGRRLGRAPWCLLIVYLGACGGPHSLHALGNAHDAHAMRGGSMH